MKLEGESVLQVNGECSTGNVKCRMYDLELNEITNGMTMRWNAGFSRLDVLTLVAPLQTQIVSTTEEH